MGSATFYEWRAKFGDMDVSMIKRLKDLEAENTRQNKMYAEERIKAAAGTSRGKSLGYPRAAR